MNTEIIQFKQNRKKFSIWRIFLPGLMILLIPPFLFSNDNNQTLKKNQIRYEILANVTKNFSKIDTLTDTVHYIPIDRVLKFKSKKKRQVLLNYNISLRKCNQMEQLVDSLVVCLDTISQKKEDDQNNGEDIELLKKILESNRKVLENQHENLELLIDIFAINIATERLMVFMDLIIAEVELWHSLKPSILSRGRKSYQEDMEKRLIFFNTNYFKP